MVMTYVKVLSEELLSFVWSMVCRYAFALNLYSEQMFGECRKKLTPFNISSEKECEKKSERQEQKKNEILEAFGHFYKAIIAPNIKYCVNKSKKLNELVLLLSVR